MSFPSSHFAPKGEKGRKKWSENTNVKTSESKVYEKDKTGNEASRKIAEPTAAIGIERGDATRDTETVAPLIAR